MTFKEYMRSPNPKLDALACAAEIAHEADMDEAFEKRSYRWVITDIDISKPLFFDNGHDAVECLRCLRKWGFSPALYTRSRWEGIRYISGSVN